MRVALKNAAAGKLASYVTCLALVGAATLLRLYLPSLFERSTFLPFFFAIAATAAVGGMKPGLVATALSVLVIWYLILPPRNSFWIENSADRVAFALFILVAGGICWLSGSRYRAQRQLAQAQVILQRSDEHYRILLEHAADLIVLRETGGRILYRSPSCTRDLGWSDEEVHASDWRTRCHPDDVARMERIRAAIRRGEETSATYRYLRKDGTYVWLEDRTRPVVDPDGTTYRRVVVVARDVTERKQADDALRESEQRMRLATEATGVGIWEWNLITDQVRWDAQMFRIYGIAPTHDGFIHYDDWRGAVLPDDLPRQEQILQDTVRRLGHSCREFRIRRPSDGQCRHIQAVETVRTNADGRAEWVLGTNLDVTERNLAEQELLQADRRKDEFLATLAHELRNPLAPIRHWLEIVKRANGDGQLIERANSTIERQVGHMVRLIDDLLDVGRIASDKLALRRERVELATIVHQAVEASRPLVDAASHELQIALPPQPVYLDADAMRLAQVFSNLVNNAAKYTEPAGRIRLTAERQGSDAVVTVTDTGAGIPTHMLSRVFDMFTQVDRTLERSQGGLGIGLTLVKRLVEMHGGSVTAHSDGPGQGSEFTVRLPVVCEPPPVLQLPAPAEADRPAARTILVVDDNRDAAETLAILLKLSGNETRTAHDGVEAFEMATAFRPDVILLDIGLPRMNGYDACRAIRGQSWGRHIALFAVTGWGQEEDRRQAREAGFDGHLVKPVAYADLLKLLDELPAAAANDSPAPLKP